MPKISFHGHRPAFMKQASTAAQPPAEARGGSFETVQKINLGFVKLKIHRPNSGVEHALRKQARAQAHKIKTQPRPSTNGFGGVRLNGEVAVAPSDQASQGHHEAVSCRHFAIAFAQHPGKKAELMKLLSERKGIEARFDGQLSNLHTSFQTMIREAPQGCKHVVSSDRLGSYLAALAATLNEGPDGPKEANCLLLTHNHAMALHVERKCSDGVDYFAAKLYDPNDTANFKRVERPNAKALGSLTLKQMVITPGFIKHYAGKGNASLSMLAFIKHFVGKGNASLSMLAVSLNHDLQPKMDRSTTTRSATNVKLALCWGAHTELQAMLQPLPQKPEEALNLLQANTSPSTGPGAFRALQDGHTESIKVFIEAVLNSNLDEQVKAELLAAKSGNRTPGLFIAFKLGHAETVKAFTEAVLNSTSLSNEVKAKLLAAKTSDDRLGLSMALQSGHTETIEVFTQAVLNSNLDESDKAALLKPVASQATSTNRQ